MDVCHCCHSSLVWICCCRVNVCSYFKSPKMIALIRVFYQDTQRGRERASELSRRNGWQQLCFIMLLIVNFYVIWIIFVLIAIIINYPENNGIMVAMADGEEKDDCNPGWGGGKGGAVASAPPPKLIPSRDEFAWCFHSDEEKN